MAQGTRRKAAAGDLRRCKQTTNNQVKNVVILERLDNLARVFNNSFTINKPYSRYIMSTITKDTPACYSNDTIRLESERIVRQEVLYCVSSLVDSLAKATAERDIDGLSYDDILQVCCQDDWETPAREYLDGLDASELKDIAEYLGVDGAEEWGDAAGDTEQMTRDIIAHCEEDNDQWRELCDYCRLDPDSVEAYEYWIVSGWLAGQLESMGEMVSRDILGLTIWGRACTGQAISMDSILLTIARNNLTEN